MSDTREEVTELIGRAFGSATEIISLRDASRGRGVFSRVLRAELCGPNDGSTRPTSVVAKLPIDGPNGEAARRSGAYDREGLAYRELLARSPVAVPTAHLVAERPDHAVALILEDLGANRAVDQLDGLDESDCLAVADSLRRFHDHWAGQPDLATLPVRRAVPMLLPPAALRAGLDALSGQWSGAVNQRARAAFGRLVDEREQVVERFAAAGPLTLCHGDPRADNLVFSPDGEPILFDWQQLAIQFGPADVAWLAATSLRPTTRRRLDADLAARYGTTFDQYRLGFVLPGLAVLLLAQRRLDDARSTAFVAASLERIGTALSDLDPVEP